MSSPARTLCSRPPCPHCPRQSSCPRPLWSQLRHSSSYRSWRRRVVDMSLNPLIPLMPLKRLRVLRVRGRGAPFRRRTDVRSCVPEFLRARAQKEGLVTVAVVDGCGASSRNRTSDEESGREGGEWWCCTEIDLDGGGDAALLEGRVREDARDPKRECAGEGERRFCLA